MNVAQVKMRRVPFSKSLHIINTSITFHTMEIIITIIIDALF